MSDSKHFLRVECKMSEPTTSPEATSTSTDFKVGQDSSAINVDNSNNIRNSKQATTKVKSDF